MKHNRIFNRLAIFTHRRAPSYLFIFLFALIGWMGVVTRGYSQTSNENLLSPTPSLEIKRITGRIVIDGLFDEKAWSEATLIDHFIQREPEENESSSERTEMRIIYDDKYLYIAFRCWDAEAEKIIANEMRRDMPLLNNDCIEIYLDTYHDHRTAFCFGTNPLGAQRDGIIMAELSDDQQNWDWNGVWDNACRIDSAGWSAEIAIPFKTLRFHETEAMIWGLNLARFIPRKREEAFWTPILRDYGWFGKYRIAAFGHLTGLRDLQHPQKFELKPFTLSGVQRDVIEDRSYQRQLNLGLDAKYHVTPNLIADITLNTDFAQVEADQEQVNLTRFELFFPEKRDFFLEGAAIFRFGERPFSPILPPSVLFFSRRIGLSEDNELVPLLGGLKMTGKVGSYNIGLLNMLANRARYFNDDDEFVKIPKTNFSMLRLQKDILNNSSIGMIGLNHYSMDDNCFHRNLGVDANIFLNSKTQVSGFLAKSFSHDTAGKDFAGYADLYFGDDFWTFLLSQNSIQDNFHAEMGFVPRTGIRKTEVDFAISPRPKIFHIRQVALFHDLNYITDQHGQLETRMNFTGWYNLFDNGAQLLGIFNQNYERLDEEFEIHDSVIIQPGIYRYNHFLSEFESDKSKAISGTLRLNIGNFYDGKIFSYGFGANLKLNSRLTLNFLYNYNDVSLTAGDFQTSIIGTRVLYTFSPKLFAKAFIQWNSDDEAVIGNFLVHFIHTPGSDLFLVYNEELDTSRKHLDPSNRVLLLKFNYLLNF